MSVSCKLLFAIGLLLAINCARGGEHDPFEAETWSTERLLDKVLGKIDYNATDADIEQRAYILRILKHRPDELSKVLPERALAAKDQYAASGALMLLSEAGLKEEALGVVSVFLDRKEMEGQSIAASLGMIAEVLMKNKAYEFAPRLVSYARGEHGMGGQHMAFQTIAEIGGEEELRVLEEEWAKIKAGRKHASPAVRASSKQVDALIYVGSIEKLKMRLASASDSGLSTEHSSIIDNASPNANNSKLMTGDSPTPIVASQSWIPNLILIISILIFGISLWQRIRRTNHPTR